MSTDQSCFAFLCTGDDHRPAAKKKEKKNKKKDKKLAPPSPNPILRNDSPDDEDVAEVSVPVGPLPGGQRTASTKNLEEMGRRNQVRMDFCISPIKTVWEKCCIKEIVIVVAF